MRYLHGLKKSCCMFIWTTNLMLWSLRFHWCTESDGKELDVVKTRVCASCCKMNYLSDTITFVIRLLKVLGIVCSVIVKVPLNCQWMESPDHPRWIIKNHSFTILFCLSISKSAINSSHYLWHNCTENIDLSNTPLLGIRIFKICNV